MNPSPAIRSVSRETLEGGLWLPDDRALPFIRVKYLCLIPRRQSRNQEETMPDLTSMSAAVGALLKERQQTVAVTESSCGGLISASLVAVPGCSAFFVGGATIYTRTAQYGLLHVAESAFEGVRSSSEPYALMNSCLLYTSPSPRDYAASRMPSSA